MGQGCGSVRELGKIVHEICFLSPFKTAFVVSALRIAWEGKESGELTFDGVVFSVSYGLVWAGDRPLVMVIDWWGLRVVPSGSMRPR